MPHTTDRVDRRGRGQNIAPNNPADPTAALNTSITGGLDAFLAQLELTNPQFFNANFQGLSPEQQAAFQQALSGASNQLGGLGGQLGGLGGQVGGLRGQVGSQLGGIGNQFLDISQGNDPRFAAFAEGRRGLLNQQRQGALNVARTQNARTGVKGTAALNDLSRANSAFDFREADLVGEIGLQQLQRQDTARGNAANVFGQRAGILSGLFGQEAGLVGQQAGLIGQQTGLAGQQFQGHLAASGANNAALEQNLNASQTGLQNLLAGPALQTAQLSANKQGGGGGGGGGGLFK